MSGWEAYVSALMENSEGIKKAAIVGADDGGVWAKSGGASAFNATPEELATFVGLYNDLASVPQKGFRLENTKYIVPRTEENLIFGKCGKDGVFAVKTGRAVVIALYEGETDKGQECRSAVEKIGSHLVQAGY